MRAIRCLTLLLTLLPVKSSACKSTKKKIINVYIERFIEVSVNVSICRMPTEPVPLLTLLLLLEKRIIRSRSWSIKAHSSL